jgi:MYXO-CTERM domain-containing protein
MADGTMWSGDDRFNISTSFGDIPYYGITYFPPEVVDGPYTAPLSLEGIIMILGADADASIQDEEGRLTGADEAGELVLEIPDAVPVLPVADGDARPGELFVLPEGAYTTTVHGRAAGTYTYAALHQGRMFAAREVGMDAATRDTVGVDPAAGSLTLGTGDADKTFEAVIVERVEDGDTTWQRTFELTEGRLMAGEFVRFATADGHDSLTIENDSSRDMRFTARLRQAELGPQPEPPDAEAHTLEIPDVEVPAGAVLKITPSDWSELGQATAELTIDNGTGQDPDPDDAAAGGCGCGTRDTRTAPGWMLVLFVLGLAIRRPAQPAMR